MSILRFENLKKELDISSMDELIDEKFLGAFKINIVTTKDKNDLNDLSNEEQLHLLFAFFDEFVKQLKTITKPYLGSEAFESFSFGDLFGQEKEKNVVIAEESQRLEAELLENEWYVLNGFNGTSAECDLLEYLKNKIGNLEEKYDQVYVLRNEEVYKLHAFKDGRGFEPDFLLFLKGKKGNLHYQVFIEPKGEHLIEHDQWKNEFLDEISKKFGNKKLLKAESKEYKLIGLPLFNASEENQFNEVFSDNLLN